MKDADALALVSFIEDGVCMRVDIDEYEEIMPKISMILYNRYCIVDSKERISENARFNGTGGNGYQPKITVKTGPPVPPKGA